MVAVASEQPLSVISVQRGSRMHKTQAGPRRFVVVVVTTTVTFKFLNDPSGFSYTYVHCATLYQCKNAIEIIPEVHF